MPKPVSRKKLIQNFRVLGFQGPFRGGRHFFMKRGDLKVRIPNEHKGDISAGLLSEILRQAFIDIKKWSQL